MLQKIACCILLASASSFGLIVMGQDLSAARSEEGIAVSEGKSSVLFYQIKPKSLNGKYERANYVHPLYSLDGKVLTEDFPDDHPHHHGIFWSWHQIIHKGKPIADGWTSENISWEVTTSRIKNKKRSVTLDNAILWKAKTDDDKIVSIVREKSRITIHASSADCRAIDFDIELIPLVDDLKIGGSNDPKGYGGFSWRINLPADIRFLGGDKEVQAQTVAVEAGPWLDFVGSLEGEGHPQSGIAVFSHPSNPRHPQRWILRDAKSMQNLAYPGREPVALPDTGWRLRYRVIVHRGKVNLVEIEKRYQEYATNERICRE